MRAFFLAVVTLLIIALGGLEAIASRHLPIVEPLPSAPVSYWK